MTATEHDEARSTAASWLVTALAGIALTGGLAISTYAARTAHEALEATIRFEERDYLRIRDLPHHIVPAAETVRRLEAIERDLREVQQRLREHEMQRDGSRGGR